MPESDLRARALRLLARREHSRAELRAKLALGVEDAEAAEAIDRLLDALEGERLLSDARYAQARVESRAARYGNARLRQELRQCGIEGEAATAALAAGGNERERCRAVWLKKYGTAASDAAERAKQMRFLQTRGFAMETIRQVITGIEDT